MAGANPRYLYCMAYGATNRPTEHAGAKHGKGAFYGRKADAKLVSRKGRRAADRNACKGD